MTMTDQNKPQPTRVVSLAVTLTAPLNPHGQCFGLIPAGGDWMDDLIDWPRRQFKNPNDAQRLAASWNLLKHVPLADMIEPSQRTLDDIAVDQFARKMKIAMGVGRLQGKGGWLDKEGCTELRLRSMLRIAISKGDPVHVGNYAMMLFQRGERTASPEAAALRAAVDESAMEKLRKAIAPAGFADAIIYLKKAFDALEAGSDSDLDHFEDEEEEAEAVPMQFAARKIAQAIELLYGYGLDAAAVPGADMADGIDALRTRNAVLEDALKSVVQNWTFQFERHGHLAPEWAKKARAALNSAPSYCTVPPPGWYCSRCAGHDGPCAAHPVAI